MNPTDKMMAWAQIGLSVLFIIATFVIIGAYETGYAHFNPDQEKSFGSTMNWLTGADLIIIYFWFSRTRTAGIPDSSQTITQTHTAPDGTLTTITSPVAAPAASVPTITTGVSNAKTNASSVPGPAIGRPI